MGAIRYTTKHDEWLKNNANSFKTWKIVAEKFNEEFGTNVKHEYLKRHCNKLGLKKSHHMYTGEEVEWLKENINNYPTKELVDLFNKEFNSNLSMSGFDGFRYRMAKGVKKDEFSKFHTRTPIGSEKKHGKYIYVKVREPKDDDPSGNWWNNCCELKQHIVWKEHYGEIPEGYQIIFLNNNTYDCRIENLYCIPKKFLPYMMHNKWFSDNPEVTLAAIKWCELMYATRN